MVTDQQVRRLFTLKEREKTLAIAAYKSGMDPKTARKYVKAGKLPSELAVPHTWSTYPDAFEEVWETIKERLELNSGLEAKTLFEDLQRKYLGRFSDGQLRTFQRRVKSWRATEGPPKEVFFPQKHYPGELSQSDFTSMNKLNITIKHQQYDHLFYHFVLTYSNWETGNICFSESFESLSEGFQNAIWELGGVPALHQTDRLSAGIKNNSIPKEFTARYEALMKHYKLDARKINANRPNENGDIEQRNHRFKKAVDQSLMLRGSRDFNSIEEYERFLDKLLKQLNSGRRERLLEELDKLGRLPMKRLESCKRLPNIKVHRGSTINVAHNTYSVNSRLINEHVNIRLYMNHLEVWHGQKKVEDIKRLRGEGKHLINYRHIIDWLVRKPGAFENYVYREEMFPTTRFRIAYDSLKSRYSVSASSKEYLKILHLAAKENELAVDSVLRMLIDSGEDINFEEVKDLVASELEVENVRDVFVSPVMLESYDMLLENVIMVTE